jgi:hypothetical protein
VTHSVNVPDPPRIKAISSITKDINVFHRLTSMRVNPWGLLPKSITLRHRANILLSTTIFKTLHDQNPCLTVLKLVKPSPPFPRTARNIMTDQEQPWYAAYPQAKADPEPINRSEVLQLLKQGKEDKDSVLVDLRRTDYEVCRCVPIHHISPHTS